MTAQLLTIEITLEFVYNSITRLAARRPKIENGVIPQGGYELALLLYSPYLAIARHGLGVDLASVYCWRRRSVPGRRQKPAPN